jgi:magnesium transporter
MTPGYGGDRARRCLVFAPDGTATPRTVDDLDELVAILRDTPDFVWLDLAQPSDDDLFDLQRIFGLDQLAIDDVSSWHDRPKVEYFEHSVFVVAHAATLDDDKFTTHEIALFIGERFAISVRAFPVFALGDVERRWTTTRSIPHNGVGLLYLILDTITDGFFDIATVYQERLLSLESHLFDSNDDSALQKNEREIFRFKRALTLFRATVAPMRDMIARLTSSDTVDDHPTLVRYFRDIQDHVVYALGEIDTTRDLLNSTYDLHLAIQGTRESQINKQLTVIATIFLPITFITGFFGQNFSYLTDHMAGAPVFWILGIGSELVTLVIIWVYFKRKGWL